MRIFTTATTMLAALALGSGLLAEAPKPVKTQSGPVQGTAEDGVTVYKGIPFAAPPLGDLRWKAPQPAASWTEVRPADKFAPACMQVPIVNATLGMDAVTTNEDCLYLNIWTPAKSAKDRLPV